METDSIQKPINRRLLYTFKLLNIVAYVFNIIVNIVGSLGKIGIASNAEVSAKYTTYLTPAGWAFSIWSVIFLLQGLFVVYQALPFDSDFQPIIMQISFLLAGVWITEALWNIAFNYELIWLSLIIILTTASFLAVTFYRLQRNPVMLFVNRERSWKTWGKHFWYSAIVYFPTSVNFGWLCIASTLNVLIAIQAYQKPVSVNACIAVASTIIIFAVGVLVIVQDIPFIVPIAWALLAVASKQKDYREIVETAYIGVAILALFSVGIFVFKGTTKRRPFFATREEYKPILK